MYMPYKNRLDRNAAQSRYRKTEKGKATTKRSKKSTAGRITQQKYIQRWRERNKIKSSAHNIVAQALRGGILIRGKCELCGVEKTVAHHDNYSKPLDVRWLCTKHHNEIHCQPRYKEVRR